MLLEDIFDIETKFKVNKMERLPLEMIIYIFGYLKLDDLAKCRLVCKSFLTATNHVKISDVVLNKSCDREIRPFWFSIQSPKHCDDPISLKSFLIYKTIFNFEHNLKRLHLNSKDYPRNHYPSKSDTYFSYLSCEVYDFQGTLQDCSLCQFLRPDSLQVALNGLRQLKQLEFYPTFYGSRIETNCEIDLPSLEIFVLDGYLDFIIDLNAPQLRVLKTSSMDRIHIRHPKSVKRIYANCLLFRLNSFENLEFLEIGHMEDDEDDFVGLFQNSIRNTLINLDFLKELHLEIVDFDHSRNFEEFKNQLIAVYQEKTVRRGQEFRVFYQGVELVDFAIIDHLGETDYLDVLKFQLENFDLLQENMWNFERVDYNRLMKLCKNALPPNYFEKYLINHVCVSGETGLELLVNFLNKLKVLYSLVICRNFNLDHGTLTFKEFFEQLKAPCLTHLSIYDYDMKTDFNGEVLLKFKALSFLTIPSAFELDLPSSLFKMLNNFVRIFIPKNKELASICITKRTFFDRFVVEFSVGDNKYLKVCDNFDQVREFCDLVERRRNPVHWVKSIGFVCLRYARDFLHFDHGQVDHLCNCNLTWYTDMLVNFIKPDIKLESKYYIGPSSELNLKEQ